MSLTQPSYDILGVWTECYDRTESQTITQVEQRDIRKLRISGEVKQEAQSGVKQHPGCCAEPWHKSFTSREIYLIK